MLCLTCLRRPAKAALGARLKGLRLAAGISRADLSRQAAIGPSTLWQIETGRHWSHQATFVRLAKALGVKVAVLTGEEPLPLDPEGNGKQRGHR